MHVDPQEIARLERELDALCLELVERFRVAHRDGRIDATTGEVKSKAFLTELGNAVLEAWVPLLRGCAQKAMAEEEAAPAPQPVPAAVEDEVDIPF